MNFLFVVIIIKINRWRQGIFSPGARYIGSDTLTCSGGHIFSGEDKIPSGMINYFMRKGLSAQQYGLVFYFYVMFLGVI